MPSSDVDAKLKRTGIDIKETLLKDSVTRWELSEEDEIELGWLSFTYIDEDDHAQGIHLKRFNISVEHRGVGIGSIVLSKLVDIHKIVCVDVLYYRAENFYRKNGFTKDSPDSMYFDAYENTALSVSSENKNIIKGNSSMPAENTIPSIIHENPHVEIESLVDAEYKRRSDNLEQITQIIADDLKQKPASRSGSNFPWVMKHDKYYMTKSDVLHALIHGKSGFYAFGESAAVNFLKASYPDTVKRLSEYMDFGYCGRKMGYEDRSKILSESYTPLDEDFEDSPRVKI